MYRLESIKEDLELFETTTLANIEWLIEEHNKMREALDRAHVLLEKYETMI